MAAAPLPLSTLDLKAQATYPIRLGSSLSQKPSKVSRTTSVRYNHKPQVKKSHSVIRRENTARDCELQLTDGEDEYKYDGRYVHNEDGFVLVCRGEGKNKELTLERLDSLFDFNLVSAPSGSGVKVADHPSISFDEEEPGDLFGEDDLNAPPDEDNPFDVRHFLGVEEEKPAPTKELAKNVRSTTGTPLAHQHPTTNTPVTRPQKRGETKATAAKKRKSVAAEKPNPKRVKAGQEPPAKAEAVPSKPQAIDIPKVRIDRKASIRRPSLDDSGELILENETPRTEKPPPRGAMSLALSGQLGGGPISLRSAASSPASRVASPAPIRPEGMDEEIEFVSSPENAESDRKRRPHPSNEDAEVDQEDDDADVEGIELPSPVQTHRPIVSSTTVTAAVDDDDDLDKALALAMAEEESEESEEE